MKKTYIITGLAAFSLALFLIVHVATTPTFSDSSTYAILSSTYTDTSGATTVNGDVGFTIPPATPPLGTQTNYGSGAPYSAAGTDQAAVLALLNAQSCDFPFGSATDLSLETQPLTPGVYCVTGAQSVGTAGITLLPGTYIFRSTGALNTVANSVVSGGDACDVFWTPVATTLGANSTFLGTDIDDAGITVGAVTNWTGRALAFGGTVTTDTDTITAPSCDIAPPLPIPTSTPPLPSDDNGGSNPTGGGDGSNNLGRTDDNSVIVDVPSPTSTPILVPICIPITNFSLSNRVMGDGQMELHWAAGNEKVTVWVDSGIATSTIVDNTGYYEAKNLNNKISHWFWVSNECSESVHIDPLP